MYVKLTGRLILCGLQACHGAKGWHEKTRGGEIRRETKETDVFVKIDLDGSGKCSANTGIGFLDHMIQQLSSHGLFDIEVRANGDTHIDDHHTNEDVGIAIGQALSKALGDRVGINRFGHFLAPLDEALIQVVVDCSGRPHLSFNLDIPSQKVGTYDTELVKEFFGKEARKDINPDVNNSLKRL